MALVLIAVAGLLTFGPYLMNVDRFALERMAERSLPARLALAPHSRR